jgi:hypothetical protein
MGNTRIIPRRPYDDEKPNGYLESDRDFVLNNIDMAIKFLERELAVQQGTTRQRIAINTNASTNTKELAGLLHHISIALPEQFSHIATQCRKAADDIKAGKLSVTLSSPSNELVSIALSELVALAISRGYLHWGGQKHHLWTEKQ